MVEVTLKLHASSRGEWRSWLMKNHDTETEIWLVSFNDRESVRYLDSVEEALCFGWIDSTAKRISPSQRVQRFTPRRRQSHWSELSKARARRLIRLGLMTEAGYAKLPDNLESPFVITNDILEAIHANSAAKKYFETLPDLYIRIRIGYIEEGRTRPEEFKKRLQNFITKSAAGKMYGRWNDGGRLP